MATLDSSKCLTQTFVQSGVRFLTSRRSMNGAKDGRETLRYVIRTILSIVDRDKWAAYNP